MKQLTLILLCLSLFSCRVAKKDWVKEHFEEKAVVKEYFTTYDSVTKSSIAALKVGLNAKYDEILQQQSVTTTESENETTTISGSIVAEDGKKKSVTVGGTTITSNGANVNFETTTTKSQLKEFESKYQALSVQYEEQAYLLQCQQEQINSLISELTQLELEVVRKKDLKSKASNKWGFQFWVWIIIGIVVILFVAYRLLKAQVAVWINN